MQAKQGFRVMAGVCALWVICGGAMLAAAQGTEDIEAMGRTLVSQMAAREFEKVVARFDETMIKALPAPKLAEVWDTIEKQVGAFQEITATRVDTVRGYRVVIVTCVFAEASVDARIVLAADGRVTGLFFAPSERKEDWKAPAYANPSAFEERTVTVGSGKWQLPGTLTLPKGKGPFAAVVLVHGSGPNDEDETIMANRPFKDLAWGLASRGVAVLRYAKRTKVHGREMMAQPGGITVNDETVDDARAGVALLASLPEINRRRIFVLGHSLGAMMAPRIATRPTSGAAVPIAGLIILAGNTRPMEDLIVEQVRYLAGLDGNISAAEQKQIQEAEQMAQQIRSPDLTPGTTVRVLGTPIPATYFLDLRNYHPAEVAAKLSIPMLILQGERDYQVRMADFEGWKKALGRRRNVTLKSYPALNHLFIAGSGPSAPQEYAKPGHVAEEVIRDIGEWVLAGGKKK
jgi:hypothetical protein